MDSSECIAREFRWKNRRAQARETAEEF